MFDKELDDIIRQHEHILQRIRGITHGAAVISKDGLPIYSSFDNTTTQSLIKEIISLVAAAKSAVRDVDASDDLKFLRLRTDDGEILVAPENEYTIIVIQ